MRRAARTDANHTDIVEAFRKADGTFTSKCTGAFNLNYKNAGWHTCLTCGSSFKNYTKTVKYCSMSCRSKSPANLLRLSEMAKMPRKKRKSLNLAPNVVCEVCSTPFRVKPSHAGHTKCCSMACAAKWRTGKSFRPLKRETRTCPQCNKEFQVMPCNTKRYCSYECHLDSGGAIRAGMAASRMTRRYGVKKDANHKTLIEYIRALGAIVGDTSNIGCGFPDIVVGLPDFEPVFLVEIKNPQTAYGRRGLNKLQTAFANEWKVYVVSSEAECKLVVDELRRHKTLIGNAERAVPVRPAIFGAH